ncbi:MAG: aminopeptidase [Lachnospiraceae bacterium]|uniref:aminopeptidase n=1 Tax=Parablautia sp. Marseille-Q6255 TaxID=3039593 RepID=UPI0024BCAB80|nr:aminopeptidase [Parablautia sp. Marseille-Q6255]
MKQENAWKSYSPEQLKELEELAVRYRAFLDAGKTERECVREAVRIAKEHGYEDLNEVIQSGKKLSAGDKVYAVFMEKAISLFHIGRKPLKKGMRILGAHIDSPRLDLKQNPLYEDTELAYLDTHYYGGVKKYQWVTIPLAIHGIVAKKDGTVVDICIGEQESDPVVFVSDLLIHLAGEQLEKKARLVIEGEDLDILIGSRPLVSEDGDAAEKKEKEAVKANILGILKEKYDIEEDDFLSAELEIVPASKSRDCGLDRSMIMAYGQDDRVCAYTSLEAQLAVDTQDYTCCCLLVDKEEIGSVGATGMQSRFFENTVAELMNCLGEYSELDLRRCLSRCRMLSSDVSAAYDPLYASYFEKKNSAYFGKGLVFNKYTGARGKSGSNDANAEYFAGIRALLEKHNVAFQTAELGKVDVGGGGTIAYISALYGMEVIDSGVAVLNMHAPMEVTSKSDVYEAKKGYLAFLLEA